MRIILVIICICLAGISCYSQEDKHYRAYQKRFDEIFDSKYNSAEAASCENREMLARQSLANDTIRRVHVLGLLPTTQIEAVFADILRKQYNVRTHLTLQSCFPVEEPGEGCFERIMDSAMIAKYGKEWGAAIDLKVDSLKKSMSQKKLNKLYPFALYKISPDENNPDKK